jgi:hypothetical protein
MSMTVQRLPRPASATGRRSEASLADKSDSPGKESARSFAGRFTHFEWKYLCSYRWFLKDLATAVETDDFSSLQIKAGKALVRARLRRSAKTVTNELSVCHSTKWYD